MKVLLVTPPMTQLNTPYPATPVLTAFLKQQGFECVQADPAIELALKLFSKQGLRDIFENLSQAKKNQTPAVKFFLQNFETYQTTVESCISFLQTKDPTLAYRIVGRRFLPEGPRFSVTENQDFSLAFGSMGMLDQAKYLASLYIDDLSDVVTYGIDEKFQLSRYGEKLARSAPSFNPLLETLKRTTLVDEYLENITENLIQTHTPSVVGLSVPFPGNVYGAFRMAQKIKKLNPKIKIILGGGYANTELRELTDPRVFDFVDAITLDDGEQPLINYLNAVKESLTSGKSLKTDIFLRTFIREKNSVVFKTNSTFHDVSHKRLPAPTYAGLPLDQYLSLLEMLNPMHRLWSDGRWNKLTLSHGCYWKKCSFCDLSLDYIGRYDPANAKILVDRIESIIQETKQTGFHFTDEAAPPALLKELSLELLRRNISITWWGNIRFEKAFTPELCELLAKAGCVAVSGGLEVASERILKLINKGVTFNQVKQVTKALSEAGILVHAYLMYGFPSQTKEETFESLENVRELFLEGSVQSAFWHRFSATVHSPIGKNPKTYGIKIKRPTFLKTRTQKLFSNNDLDFQDLNGCDEKTLERLGVGLNRALYNYMHGIGFELPIKHWFQ